MGAVLAVSGVVWAVAAAILAGSLALIVRALLRLWRHLMSFVAAVGEATDHVNREVEAMQDQLREVQEGMERVRSRRLREP